MESGRNKLSLLSQRTDQKQATQKLPVPDSPLPSAKLHVANILIPITLELPLRRSTTRLFLSTHLHHHQLLLAIITLLSLLHYYPSLSFPFASTSSTSSSNASSSRTPFTRLDYIAPVSRFPFRWPISSLHC